MQNLSVAAKESLSGTPKTLLGSLPAVCSHTLRRARRRTTTQPKTAAYLVENRESAHLDAMIGLAVSFLIAASPVPVMDVLQVYGRLAGPECFGKTVPAAAGASCQLTAERIRETIGDVTIEAGFEARLAALPFRWPLKPYGTAASPSNVKTVAINKNAETAVYMRELEQRRLGITTPTTRGASRLRNRQRLSHETGRSTRPARRASRTDQSRGARTRVPGPPRRANAADWFSFLERIGAEQVVWPRY